MGQTGGQTDRRTPQLRLMPPLVAGHYLEARIHSRYRLVIAFCLWVTDHTTPEPDIMGLPIMSCCYTTLVVVQAAR